MNTVHLDLQAVIEPVRWPVDAVEVGKVLGSWGVKGAIKVLPFSSEPEALLCAKRWYVRFGSTLPDTNPAVEGRLKVNAVHRQGDVIVANLADVTNRSVADVFKGARVFIPRAAFPTPQPDEYYWVDLLGLQVVNQQGQSLGCVLGLLETGPHCVLRCQEPGSHAPERLIPFVGTYVERVSLTERLIVVDWGLDF